MWQTVTDFLSLSYRLTFFFSNYSQPVTLDSYENKFKINCDSKIFHIKLGAVNDFPTLESIFYNFTLLALYGGP